MTALSSPLDGPLTITHSLPKRIRRYCIVAECPSCERVMYFDDFTGEHEAECVCGMQVNVSLTEGLGPSWVWSRI